MTTPVATHALALTGALRTTVSEAGPGLAGRAALIVLLLAAASTVWWVASRRAARFTSDRRRPGPDEAGQENPAAGTAILSGADLGRALGARATFVQFSAQTCASCPQVHRILSSLSETEPGVVHVNLPAQDHMDLVRRFSVFRTPTVLLLNAHGAVHSRTSGPLARDRALAALAALAQLTELTPLTARSANV